MIPYLQALENEFKSNANPLIAKEQQAYMKNKFLFWGIKTPDRRKIQQPFLVKKFLPTKQEGFNFVKILWSKPQREFHYFAQELVFSYKKQFTEEDVHFLEDLVTQNSWWDTVDFIATKLIAVYFQLFPHRQEEYSTKWINSSNIWLQRTTIIFQLKYKKETDTKLLSHTIASLHKETDFFIKKAIGWALREYGKTNPKWVLDFVEKTALSNLSQKEATKLLL